MKDDYLRYCLITQMSSKDFRTKAADVWIPKEDMASLFKDTMRKSLVRFDLASGDVYDRIAESVLEELIYMGVIRSEGDEYAGEFYQIPDGPRGQYVTNFVNSNEVAKRIQALGPSALPRAIARIAAEDGLTIIPSEGESSTDGVEQPQVDLEVPASDRLVTLSHNEISAFEEQTSEVISHVEKLNGIEGPPGFREVLLGQLRAGRELIRAGSFKIYLAQITLIETLLFLAKRYERETVGVLAAALAAALVKQFGVF